MNLLMRQFERLLVLILKRNEFESVILRKLFLRRFGISVGLYSYGCFDTKRIPKNTAIGRYCSFSRTAHIFNGNHGVAFLSTHPYLYNASLGVVTSETISRTACQIEDDVWLGHNSVVLPSVKVVGRGAIVAAGAVVTKDVPRYAIVAGNPAAVIRYRFDHDTIVRIESSEWWNLNKHELEKMIMENSEFVFSPASGAVRTTQ